MPELHPHLWTPHKPCVDLWFSEDGYAPPGPAPSSEEGHATFRFAPRTPGSRSGGLKAGLYLSHNGDFDEYDIFGQRLTSGAIGRWLARVLDQPNELKGDSPKVAGLIELLHTRGNWAASVRLAYQRDVAKSIADAFGGDAACGEETANTAPTAEWCTAVGERFAAAWQIESSSTSSSAALDITERIVTAVASDGEWRSLLEQFIPAGTMLPTSSVTLFSSFVRVVIDRFCSADLFGAMSEFLSQAHGSFGLQVVAASDPSVLVIGAKVNFDERFPSVPRT